MSANTGFQNRVPAAVLERLACPGCRGALSADAGGRQLGCSGCSLKYPIRDGVPFLARAGGAETWGGAQVEADSTEYQTCFETLDGAQRYRQRYRKRWRKRLATWREKALLRRLLKTQPRCGVLLDLPCGGGRVSEPLAAHTDMLVEADIAAGQVMLAREGRGPTGRKAFLTASAFHIPFRDRSVDGVVCNRLTHHLPSRDEQGRLIAELLRVARGFVILSFIDHYSLKAFSRRLRYRRGGKAPTAAMKASWLAELAAGEGMRLAACPSMWLPGSRLRYALLVREDAPQG